MWYKVKKIRVGTKIVRPETIPLNWLLWYRPLQSDLKDASWNWKDWSWYSGTGSFETVWWKTWARMTVSNTTYSLSSQHIITSLTYCQRPISICYWIYPYTANDNYPMIWNWDTSTSSIILTVASNPRRIVSYLNWNSFGRYKANDYTLTLNAWNCIWFSSDANWTQWYISWQPVASSLYDWTYPTTLVSSWLNVKIGSWQYSGYWSKYHWVNWIMREVAIYNRVLTDAEVLQFYNNTK